jgi:hypothetical protein
MSSSSSSSKSGLLLLLLTISCLCLHHVQGYASYMTQSSYCSRALTVGTTIMGRAAVSSTSRTISVTRNGSPLTSGASYVYGETLVATLSSTSSEYVMQVSGGAVVSGGSCGATRKALSSVTFTMPASGTATISVVSGWTTSQSQAVRITPSFSLVAPSGGGSPVTSPTLSPASTPMPTLSPASTPSPSTSNGSNEQENNTDNNTSGSSYSGSGHLQSFSNLSASAKGGLGFLMGAGSLMLLYSFALCVAQQRVEKAGIAAEQLHESQKTYTFSRVGAGAAILLGLTALVLTRYWAQNKTNGDMMYLGVPSWTNNLFAWHPVLMTAGFFVAQLFALAAWSFFSVAFTHYNAKLMHVFWQVVALSTMIAGLWAVWRYKMDNQLQSFTTTHSWIGIATVALYGYTFAWGSFMAILTRFYPDSILRKAFDLKGAHKNLGLACLFLTAMCVLTGVMDQLPQGLCNATSSVHIADAAASYPHTPDSCRVANGLSMVTLIATVLGFFIVMYRGDSFGFQFTPTATSSSRGRGGTAPPSNRPVRPVRTQAVVTHAYTTVGAIEVVPVVPENC